MPDPATAGDACAACGFPRYEHSYNGACYGLCGAFVVKGVPAQGGDGMPAEEPFVAGLRAAKVAAVQAFAALQADPKTWNGHAAGAWAAVEAIDAAIRKAKSDRPCEPGVGAQAERFRFALQMCRDHANRGVGSTEPARACGLVISQVDAAFRIEQELHGSGAGPASAPTYGIG